MASELGTPTTAPPAARVVAVIVTYCSPANLSACLESLSRQSYLLDQIVIVDNSPVPTCITAPDFGTLKLEHLFVGENLGPAGGYRLGLIRFLSLNADYAWLLDDDVFPDSHCLEALLREACASRRLVWPRLVDAATREPADTWGWVGVLVPRSFVEQAELPMSKLFYGLEDLHYLIDQPCVLGYRRVRSKEALARLVRRPYGEWAVWHHYYQARNATYLHFYGRSHVGRLNRLKRWTHHVYSQVRVAIQSGGAPRRVGLTVLGVVDGLRGKLGVRILPSPGSRPAVGGRRADP